MEVPVDIPISVKKRSSNLGKNATLKCYMDYLFGFLSFCTPLKKTEINKPRDTATSSCISNLKTKHKTCLSAICNAIEIVFKNEVILYPNSL